MRNPSVSCERSGRGKATPGRAKLSLPQARRNGPLTPARARAPVHREFASSVLSSSIHSMASAMATVLMRTMPRLSTARSALHQFLARSAAAISTAASSTPATASNHAKPVHIVGICGSLRAASFNGGCLRVAAANLPHGVSLEVLSANLPLYNGDVEARGIPSSVQAFKDKVNVSHVRVVRALASAVTPLMRLGDGSGCSFVGLP